MSGVTATVGGLPFVLGISGGAPDPARALPALTAIFAFLDRRFPSSPKILLSTLDSEFARFAADAVVGRPGWRVVAVLPLSPEVLSATFDTLHRGWWETFVGREDVITLPLRPLADHNSAKAESTAALTNIEHHLEQGRLFVACHAHLLVYLKEEGAIDTPSNTRLLNYKLNLTMDSVAQDVVSRSSHLFNPAMLDDIAIGPVWQIAPAETSTGSPLVQVSVAGAHDLTLADEEGISSSIPLADRLEEFNRSFGRLRVPDKTPFQPGRSHEGSSANDVLREFSDDMSEVLQKSQRTLRLIVWLLPVFFLLAAGSFEFWLVRSAVPPGQLGISLYAVFTSVGIFLYWRSTSTRLQVRSEEYRAVVEALRVQKAWWDCGLTHCAHRVDQYYLLGARSSLHLVRYAIHGIVNAATVMAPFARPDQSAPVSWIQSQIDFFTARISRRRHTLSWFERFSWLFFMLGLLSATLALGVQATNDWGATSLPASRGVPHGVVPATRYGGSQQIDSQTDSSNVVVAFERLVPMSKVIIGLFALVLILLTAATLSTVFLPPDRWPVLQGAVVLVTVAVVIILGLADLSKILGGTLGASLSDLQFNKWDIGPHPLLDLFAGFATLCAALVAGARYVMEKFSWRAELHSYEEALEIFNRAKAAIANIDLREVDAENERNQVIIAAGKQALAENERWLREHRERPLEPVFST